MLACPCIVPDRAPGFGHRDQEPDPIQPESHGDHLDVRHADPLQQRALDLLQVPLNV